MIAFAQKLSSKDTPVRRHSAVNDTSLPRIITTPITTTSYPFLQTELECPCDGGCPTCAPVIQPKLIIGQSNDKYEQEADRIADLVMRMPAFQVPKEAVSFGPAQTATVPSIVHEVLDSPGRSLDKETRTHMELHFGHDFSRIRIHTDAKAAESARLVNARAYTVGDDIAFDAGQYAPDTNNGKKLLAHELTHTLQNSGYVIKRLVELANTKSLPAGLYDSSDLDLFYATITGNHANLEALISGTGKVYEGIGSTNGETSKDYRVELVKDILEGLLNSATAFYYADESEVFDDVYKRAAASLYMRTSQGTRSVPKVRYPGSVGPKPNKEASAYWIVTTGGQYKFELNANGKANAYEALRTLLFEATRKETTRMHCDYVIAAIHFMTMAEDIGIADFDDAVSRGDIVVWLKAPDSFDPTVPESLAVLGAYTTTVAYDPAKKSLGKVLISGESELIVGDHLMFYNHSAYNAMNREQGESWRLENAFVTDREGSGGGFRFQGHGYYSPKDRMHFIRTMLGKFNKLYSRAEVLITAGKETECASEFPFVRLKISLSSSKKPNDHEVVYGKDGTDDYNWSDWRDIPFGNRLTMELKKLTESDYPNPFAKWGEKKEMDPAGTASFWVRRPVEGFMD